MPHINGHKHPRMATRHSLAIPLGRNLSVPQPRRMPTAGGSFIPGINGDEGFADDEGLGRHDMTAKQRALRQEAALRWQKAHQMHKYAAPSFRRRAHGFMPGFGDDTGFADDEGLAGVSGSKVIPFPIDRRGPALRPRALPVPRTRTSHVLAPRRLPVAGGAFVPGIGDDLADIDVTVGSASRAEMDGLGANDAVAAGTTAGVNMVGIAMAFGAGFLISRFLR